MVSTDDQSQDVLLRIRNDHKFWASKGTVVPPDDEGEEQGSIALDKRYQQLNQVIANYTIRRRICNTRFIGKYKSKALYRTCLCDNLQTAYQILVLVPHGPAL
jgi:hypothetical protein